MALPCCVQAVFGCVASIVVLPFASILSPIYGLIAITRTLLLYKRAQNLHPLALSQVASGVATRRLHSFAIWQEGLAPHETVEQQNAHLPP